MESKKMPLKNKLARLFQVSTLLRSPCSHSTTTTTTSSSSSTADSRTSPSPVIDPVFLPRNNSFVHRSTNPPFLHGKIGRSLSLPLKLSSSFLDTKKNKIEKKEKENSGTHGRICSPASPTSPKKKKKTKKLLSNGYGFSSSSDDDDFFSSEEEEYEKNIFSSRSFSSDSSEFYRSNRKKKTKKPNHYRGFRPLVSLTGKEEGIPVTKRSNDPYVDFRDSMVEMIVERQIFGAEELEKLVYTYLCLNSPRHQPVILRAFAEISEVLFGN